MATNDEFAPGKVIKLYGVYRCSCGNHEFFGISGRVFPRPHCHDGAWQMVHRARQEKFF
jgi:hypothetical protein